MKITNNIFQEYYDKLYTTKDYAAEVEIILRIAYDKLGKAPESILDVGCGTGGHSLLFAEKGYKVVGADIDQHSIDVARCKSTNLKSKNLTLLCGDVNKIELYGFDMIVSLFNVVNYIHKIDDLTSFFKGIYSRLTAPGLYVFDCWNGLAAILDLPREKETRIMVDT